MEKANTTAAAVTPNPIRMPFVAGWNRPGWSVRSAVIVLRRGWLANLAHPASVIRVEHRTVEAIGLSYR